jgi:hypothetical protein
VLNIAMWATSSTTKVRRPTAPLAGASLFAVPGTISLNITYPKTIAHAVKRSPDILVPLHSRRDGKADSESSTEAAACSFTSWRKAGICVL